MRVAIDLLWVRHGISGGTETVIRNLLHGFGQYAFGDEFILLVAKDNVGVFLDYKKYRNFSLVVCNVLSAKRWKRVLWQKMNINHQIVKLGANIYFSPIYSTPGVLSVPTIAVIHDLQAFHYPEYFSTFRNKYMYWNWQKTCDNADAVVTISKFCKKDILKNLCIDEEKVNVIYNPILSSDDEILNIDTLKKFGVKENKYYYTVSSLAKHKNLITLLRAFKLVVNADASSMLVITGIKVNAANEITNFVKEKNIENNVVFTGFISDKERDSLYMGCKLFLYPSVFEGFGMPPIEAMLKNVPVLTTKKTSLNEVTMGFCNYVNDPYSVEEWVSKMHGSESRVTTGQRKKIKEMYSLEKITKEYRDLMCHVCARGYI